MVNLNLIQVDAAFEKILKNQEELKKKATFEFAKLKDIPVEEAMEMKGDWNLILELERYTTEYVGKVMKNHIPDNVISDHFNIKRTEAEWTILPNNPKNKAFLYFFGGGYVAGSLSENSYVRYLLSKYMNLNVLGIDYSLAPEKPFPAALEDAIKGYDWLLSNGFESNEIFIGGASAGGGLAMAMLLKARDLGLEMPRAAILISPWVDLKCRAKSIKKFRDLEPELGTGLKPISYLYSKGESKKNPYLSPLFGDLNGLPPLLIHAGSHDGLLDDAKNLAEKARDQEVEVELKIWENMPHDFHKYGDNHPTGRQAFEEIAAFINKHL
ncbi:MAG: alpha/beta hydrolase [Promethearchaeati archaeon]